MDPAYSRQEEVQKDQKEKHNVYATPFVPDRLRRINTQPGSIIKSSSRHHIDYAKYVGSFAASSFLPRRVSGPTAEPFSTPNSDEPYANNYLTYFSSIWRTEIIAQGTRNGSFSLYKVALSKLWSDNGQHMEHRKFTLTIPGLREENPHVGLGDTLELRQLLVDPLGNLIPEEFFINSWTESWTGMILHASIDGIHRATETVYLRVDGLQEYSHMDMIPMPLFVNVVFPIQEKDFHASRIALALISDALDKALDREREKLRRNDNLEPYEQVAKEMVGLLIDDDGKPILDLESPDEPGSDPVNNYWIRTMLFPVASDGTIQTKLRKIPHQDLFDSAINWEQAQSIMSICEHNYGNIPYLISGPPGTGKTKTIVETAMQLLLNDITDHILICAPSESAADTLALRLKRYFDPNQLLRLNGPWRADNEVPRELMPYTYLEDDMFTLPNFKQFMAYSIVITSCKDAAILVGARLTNTDLWYMEKSMIETFHPKSPPVLPKLHWGALLLDEAAQATELDVLPAIYAVTPAYNYPNALPQPRFVLAGDEKQLGPRTASRDPQFSQSLFARLFARPMYASHPLSRTNMKPSSGSPVLKKSMLPMPYPAFTNLIRNYRSHPAILSIPSALFYADSLIPEAPPRSTPLQHSSLWQGARWPVLFVPHAYVEDIERDGGGWYNAGEARLACTLAAHLIRHDEVVQSDIAIISPFAAQVKHIRALIRTPEFGFWNVDIGPLEAFQGLEKRVVILATTRTRGKNFVERDVERGLGLIHQPRKMNVALTRAKEGLVVLGNAVALGKDDCWRAWLAFCWRNGLVRDREAWKDSMEGKYAGEEEGKIGVLELALLARDMKAVSGAGEKVLGKAAVREGYGHEAYEAWVESLKEAMDEGEEGFEDEEGGDQIESKQGNETE